MSTKYDLQFKGISHLPGDDGLKFHTLMKTTSDFILNTMSQLNEDYKKVDVEGTIQSIHNSTILADIAQITQYGEQETNLIQIMEDRKPSFDILDKIDKEKATLRIIYDNMNNIEQLRDFCSRVVDFITAVSDILKNVDLWNCKYAVSYLEKLKLFIKTMVEYKKSNSGRTVIMSEIIHTKKNGDLMVNAVYNFMTNRASNYGKDEGEVNITALSIKTGFDQLYAFVVGTADVTKVKEFKTALDKAEEFLNKEFPFGVVVNVEKKDVAEQAMLQLENAKTQDEKDKASILLMNELDNRAEFTKDEKKKKILAKVSSGKKQKKNNYKELLVAARKLANNVDELKEVVYSTDVVSCIDAVSLTQIRDEMLGTK
ncbi:hypothetical protein EIN_129150 [Entamoeba invadens IP1]|uniref:Uncharacterized protein n=2 Tax=Entamoeba invadens TaxID=33085 RepID=L7FPI7_ENTIV|nr:hypothetical protein EIN_129150 [Entamoeba invadens IP1]ELP91575.1 hypothetical protein EIN_129150 [Entamoeba invadens IP1]BAN41011.1 hypothetical protein [Entamoeba invadens]|eukprot:XP_004258346.1 hypothetical protein EIN_129150 [Entamoeba invadens IP1]